MNRIMNQSSRTNLKDVEYYKLTHEYLLNKSELSVNTHPSLRSFSGAFVYVCLPRPEEEMSPEYVYIASSENVEPGIMHNRAPIETQLFIADWNLAWESGQLRHYLLKEKIPKELKWINRYKNHNIFLIPRFSFHRYDGYSPLYHLIPAHILEYNDLPLLKGGQWPPLLSYGIKNSLLPRDFDQRLSKAFAYYIWPSLISGSKISAFSPRDPIKLLAHNLDYWLPNIHKVIENRLKAFGRVDNYEDGQRTQIARARAKNPRLEINRPFRGGTIWQGKDEAKEATREMIEYADSNGQLRSIIDAIKSNRIEDDFSERWSYAKEDFERKLYRKRSKYKVTFVELKDTIPVQGPETEIHGNLFWEDFFALLNDKEKRIVVCLREGTTKLGEISRILGYANHSPVSKALARIRQKAKRLIDRQ